MQYTLTELIQNLPEDLQIQIKGDPLCRISGVGTIQNALSSDITFLVNPLYKKFLTTTHAAAIILSYEDADESISINQIISKNPYFTYAKIAAFFNPKTIPSASIHPSVSIGENCQIHATASIGANSVIGNNVKIAAGVIIGPGCVIGDESEIGESSCFDANVTIYDRMVIGKEVQISSGTVIGSDGFGIAKHNNIWFKVPQLGRVIIKDQVEIGSNCSIDRGAIEDTVIEKGVKLDNLIQVGHNVRIGENTAIAGCVGISGSSSIGKNCLIGGGVGIVGHITITDNVVITGATVVSKSIHEAGIYSSGVGGLTSHQEWRKNSARFHRLNALLARIKLLETNLQELTEREK